MLLPCIQYSYRCTITHQWMVCFTASLTLSSSSRRPAISVKIFNVWSKFSFKAMTSITLTVCSWCSAGKSGDKSNELVCYTTSFHACISDKAKYLFIVDKQTRTPSKLSSMFSGTQDKCAVCNKTAYPLEKACSSFFLSIELFIFLATYS